ncbi:MAG: 2-amino-4-hydroxy-6-hydroxymethyldihydropteridine diphosphokinase [Maribacter sp.]|nr:2-amino-4-hydroxy-6-hydroxymethyldihydropteridine diphosphokinase [Maribacter sp.]
MNRTKTAYLSIGSNLGEKLPNLQQAIVLLGKELGRVIAISKVYECPAWGFVGANFLNICISLETTFSPNQILERILDIEQMMGRRRNLDGKGYVSRNIDIDILYFDSEIINSGDLTLPHPKMTERRFVLGPLADIAPQFYHPILKKDTRNLLQECKDKSILEKTPYVLYTSRESLFMHKQFMAIEGNIGAGKTSLAKKIAFDFNGKLVLERFADNPFLPNFYRDQARYAFPLEMSFLADRYQQFTDDTSQYDLFKNFMVSDYDIFKSLIFAKITLQKQEFDLYRKIFNVMYKEVKKPKIYVYLYQNTHRLLENIKKRGRDYEQEIHPEYLEKINRGYFDYIKGYPELSSLVLDISELDFLEHPEDYEKIVRAIQDFAVSQSN